MAEPRRDRPQRGTSPTHPPQPPMRAYAYPQMPREQISAIVRAGVVAGLREAAARDDAAHIAGIATGGLDYVQAWLTQAADDIESREYEKEADGNYEN